jgi:hypothetical protein
MINVNVLIFIFLGPQHPGFLETTYECKHNDITDEICGLGYKIELCESAV